MRQENISHWPNSERFFEDGCPFCGTDVFLERPEGFECTDCGSVFEDLGASGVDLLSGPEDDAVLLSPPDEAA